MVPNFNRIVEIGYALIEKGSTGRCWHLSAILNKSKILSLGINNYKKTHPQNEKFGYYPLAGVHAEMGACLRLGLTDCSGLTIVNLRINRKNEIANSKFCHGCSNLIKSLNFKEAFYSTDLGDFQQYNLTA